jgi:hypothetical protein
MVQNQIAGMSQLLCGTQKGVKVTNTMPGRQVKEFKFINILSNLKVSAYIRSMVERNVI